MTDDNRSAGAVHWSDFAGWRSGRAALTWGQRAIWAPTQWYAPNDAVFNFSRVVALPGGTTSAGVYAKVDSLLRKYEALRTTYVHTGDGTVAQVLYGTGRIAGGRAIDEAAARYWSRQLRKAPRTMFTAEPVTGREPMWWHGRLTSAALDTATRAVAHRTGVSGSAVLLAAASAALADYTAAASCALLVVLSNRTDPILAATIGTITQDASAVIEVAGRPFAAVIEQAQAELSAGRACGRYDPDTRAEAERSVAAAGGGPVDLRCYFNNSRFDEDSGYTAPVAVQREEITALAAKTSFAWLPGSAMEDSAFFLNVEQAPGELNLTLLADTRLIPLAVIEGMLRGIEARVLTYVDSEDFRALEWRSA
jgi:hypothetical protein